MGLSLSSTKLPHAPLSFRAFCDGGGNATLGVPAKRKRALLRSNLPRNSRPETNCDATGAGEQPLVGVCVDHLNFASSCWHHTRFPHALKTSFRSSSSVPPADQHTYPAKTQSEASLPFVGGHRRQQPCIRCRMMEVSSSIIQTMMQPCASGRRGSSEAGPILSLGLKPWVAAGHPLPRIVLALRRIIASNAKLVEVDCPPVLIHICVIVTRSITLRL